MRRLTLCLVAAVTLAPVPPAAAQRRARIGPMLSWLSLRDGAGTSHTYPSFGGSVALLTGDDAETGFTVSRYNDLAQGDSVRRLTFFGLDSYYYPVGAKGVAPFASVALGLARVTESASVCPLLCKDTVSTTSQLGLGFGLGVRVGAGDRATALVEARFFQVPATSIQALEARANVSRLLGQLRAQCDSIRAGLRAVRTSPVGPGLWGDRRAARGLLRGRQRSRHRAGGPRRSRRRHQQRGVAAHQPQQPPDLAAAELRRERLRGSDRRRGEPEGAALGPTVAPSPCRYSIRARRFTTTLSRGSPPLFPASDPAGRGRRGAAQAQGGPRRARRRGWARVSRGAVPRGGGRRHAGARGLRRRGPH